jgi:hypothetical protein
MLRAEVNTQDVYLLRVLVLLGDVVEGVVDALEGVRVLELEEGTSGGGALKNRCLGSQLISYHFYWQYNYN